jgi:hypothetical protein
MIYFVHIDWGNGQQMSSTPQQPPIPVGYLHIRKHAGQTLNKHIISLNKHAGQCLRLSGQKKISIVDD